MRYIFIIIIAVLTGLALLRISTHCYTVLERPYYEPPQNLHRILAQAGFSKKAIARITGQKQKQREGLWK